MGLEHFVCLFYLVLYSWAYMYPSYLRKKFQTKEVELHQSDESAFFYAAMWQDID